MNTFKRVSLISAVAAAFAMTAAVTVPAMAQTPTAPQATTPAPQFKQGEHRQHREARAFSKPTERVEARLAYQRTALKITPQQQTQWDRYASYVRKQAQDMEKRFTDMSPRGSRPATPPASPPNAIQRLEQQQAMLSQASNSLNERIAVQKPLYAALSPEQQKVADQVLNPRRGGMGGMDGKRNHGGRGERGDHRFGHMG